MKRLSEEVRKQTRQFDSLTQMSKNCIRFDEKSGICHKVKLMKLCERLLVEEIDFFTRARLKNNEACADAYIIPTNTIVEIQDCESDESIARKRKLYEEKGFNFDVVKV